MLTKGHYPSSAELRNLRWTNDDFINFRQTSTFKETLSSMWDSLLEGSSMHGVRFLNGWQNAQCWIVLNTTRSNFGELFILLSFFSFFNVMKPKLTTTFLQFRVIILIVFLEYFSTYFLSTTAIILWPWRGSLFTGLTEKLPLVTWVIDFTYKICKEDKII